MCSDSNVDPFRGRKANKPVFGDQARERPILKPGATDIVEPDALPQSLKPAQGFIVFSQASVVSRHSVRPLPLINLRHVLAVLGDVVPVLDQPVAQLLHVGRAVAASARSPYARAGSGGS
jgi:hypothetical protein